MQVHRQHKNVLLGLLLFCLLPIVSFANVLTVDEVMAGDFLRFGDWKTHITGITAPAPDTEWGKVALDFAIETLQGKAVKVFTLTTNNTAAGIVYGEDGNAFATILCGENRDQDFAVLLLERGLAKVNTETLQEDQQNYLEVEKKARDKKLGLWSDETE